MLDREWTKTHGHSSMYLNFATHDPASVAKCWGTIETNMIQHQEKEKVYVDFSLYM
jgi:hypothetical protein